MAGVTSVSSLAPTLPPAPPIAAPVLPDSTPRQIVSPTASARSQATASYGLLASGVLSTLLQAQSAAEGAVATSRSALETATAAVNAYAAAQSLPGRPPASASITQLEGVVIYTS